MTEKDNKIVSLRQATMLMPEGYPNTPRVLRKLLNKNGIKLKTTGTDRGKRYYIRVSTIQRFLINFIKAEKVHE